MEGWREGTPGKGTKGPQAAAQIPAPWRLLSLPLPALISRLSPHISESAFFSDRRGGCLTYIPPAEELRGAPAAPAGMDRSWASIRLPSSHPPHHSQNVS